jgi:hypothetical protein
VLFEQEDIYIVFFPRTMQDNNMLGRQKCTAGLVKIKPEYRTHTLYKVLLLKNNLL